MLPNSRVQHFIYRNSNSWPRQKRNFYKNSKLSAVLQSYVQETSITSQLERVLKLKYNIHTVTLNNFYCIKMPRRKVLTSEEKIKIDAYHDAEFFIRDIAEKVNKFSTCVYHYIKLREKYSKNPLYRWQYKINETWPFSYFKKNNK